MKREIIKEGNWFYNANNEVIVICPKCNQLTGTRNHIINSNGDMNNSFLCPFCKYHTWVNLQNYVFKPQVYQNKKETK